MTKKSMVLMPVLALALVANLLLAPKVAAQPPNAYCLVHTGDSASTEGLLQEADVVFSGEVVAVEPVNVIPIPEQRPSLSTDLRNKRALATFDVEESWKGVFEEPVVVLGEALVDPHCTCTSDGTVCTNDGGTLQEAQERFHEGDRLLVFATKRGTEEDFWAAHPKAELPGGRDPADFMVGKEEFDKEIPLGTIDLSSGTKPLDNAEADLLVLGSAERAFPESVGPGSAEPTPVSYTRDNVANIAIVASGALLFIGTLGVLTLWRWRCLTQRDSVGGS